MESTILQIAEKQLSQEISSDSSQAELSNKDVPVSESTGDFTNVFSERVRYGCVLPVELQPDPKVVTELQRVNKVCEGNLIIKSVALPAICECTHFSPKDPSPELTISTISTQEFKPLVMSIKLDDRTPKRLENPHEKELAEARLDLIFKSLNLWTIDKNPYSPEETELVKKIALLFSNAYHLSMQDEDLLVLTTNDFSSVVSVIKKLAKKVGLAELGAMVLLAIAVSDAYFLHKSGYKGEADFFQTNADLMQISASCARDFAIRGRIFLQHRIDILNGIEDVTGISLETLANTCLAKLTLYEKAVDKFGNKQALVYLKTLSFREFKKIIPSKPSRGLSLKKEKRLKDSEKTESDYDLRLKELNLLPNEKRLLRIRAKRGIDVAIFQILSEYQVSLIESRYREYRFKTRQDYYKSRSERWVHYKPADTDNPLKIDDLCFQHMGLFQKIVGTREDYLQKWYEHPDDPQHPFENRIFDYADIVLRIRAGLSQIQPSRRAIAVLLFKLVNEKAFKNKWKNPREGVEYKSFRDFTIEELGLRENYRDYLAVGKVLKEYYIFLDHLSDVDTEETFLKLRHLPDALKTHKDDEYLVLARLRSLSVREFKKFSVDPDFELHFGRRLTKKELDDFVEFCKCSLRGQGTFFRCAYKMDFIEAYDKDDYHLILRIADKVIEETSLAIVPPAPMVDVTNASEKVDEATNDGVHTGLDDLNQPLTVPAA